MQSAAWKAGTALAAGAAVAAGLAAAGTAPATAAPDRSGVVINEAYVSGGSATAPFDRKFVELHNPTGEDIDLTGLSLQYRSATGTGGSNSVVPLSGTIPANGYFLVAGASNNSSAFAGDPLPTPDLESSLSPSGSRGTVVLANTASAITLPTGAVEGHPAVVDLLGYGSNTYEGAPAAGLGGTSDQRSLNRAGGTDTDNNAADFSATSEITPTASGGQTPQPEPEPEPEPEPAVRKTIAEIQGTGEATPLAGQTVATRGIVTAVFPTGGFDGYYLQTPGTGGAATAGEASHGIFVYSRATVDEVALGDHVEVTGTAGEYYGLTQLTVPTGGATVLDEPAEPVEPLAEGWPASEDAREASEGMLWDPQGRWTVSDNYSLNSYGELGLAAGTSKLVPGTATLPQPTDIAPAGSAEAAAIAAENAERRVLLDDGSTVNFMGSDANKDIPLPYLTLAEPVRVGAPVDFTDPVVLDYRHEEWRFQPRTRLTGENPEDRPASFGDTREEAPEEVGGNVKLASFNVLNYFTTTGDQLAGCTFYEDRDGEPVGVRGGCDARGAADAGDLERQQAKIVAAVNGLDADVVSLEEIENSAAFGKDRDEALARLTAALNAALPEEEQAPGAQQGQGKAAVWDYVRSPDVLPADEDVIRTAFIYKRDAVKPIGESVILDHEAFSNARQPLAQTFMKVGGNNATKFVTIVNHFKSKGSAPRDGSANDDRGDGQGAWNAARVAQARALVDFAEGMKELGNTEKVFLTGDFNSYTQEDPMRVFYDAGYVNQTALAAGETYLFDGLVGSLDHILASPAAHGVVTGRDIWDINADEPIALEYSRHNYNAAQLFAPDAFRASDHDPVLVGIQLDKE